jgi:hypothetical protein
MKTVHSSLKCIQNITHRRGKKGGVGGFKISCITVGAAAKF